ncbi:MAG: glycosyltransferase [Bacteroidetes bacterium]|nr:glycosyltransferase [Bacteroidota bacterium]HET6244043.1 glycosyltransferase [Bacteroidia bacterium]
MINFSISIEFIVFVVFFATFLVLLFYYLFVFGKFAFYKKKQSSVVSATPPVTVVIAAKNEEENLRKNLPLILAQDYPEFEVIVVNDFSTDETEFVLEQFQLNHSNFRAITIKQEGLQSTGKKYPLTLGIKGAKHERILLIDADCFPKSDNWIKRMSSNYSEGIEVVLGYGKYEKKPGLLNKLIRFDTFFIALQYYSFALCGNPYMGVGRNLSYEKSLFFKHKGFAKHTHIASGDDDLFIGKVANENNTAIEFDIDSHTFSKPKRTLRDWVRQKRRHLTTGKLYKLKIKFALGLLGVSNFIFILVFVALILLNYQINLIVIIFLTKLSVQMIIFRKSMDKLGERDLWFLAPLLDLFLIFYYPYLFFSKAFIKQSKWK